MKPTPHFDYRDRLYRSSHYRPWRVTTTPKLPGDLEVTSRDIVRHEGVER
jgi:hypothetical protein